VKRGNGRGGGSRAGLGQPAERYGGVGSSQGGRREIGMWRGHTGGK